MIVLIEHKQHGRMHVYSQLELDNHIQRGWYPVIQEVQQVNNVVPIKKRGRPRK